MVNLKMLSIACITSSLLGAGLVVVFFASQYDLRPTNSNTVQANSVPENSKLPSPNFPTNSPAAVPALNSSLPQPGLLTAEEQNNIDVYENAHRSVVNIRTLAREDDVFSFREVTSEGSGSGWILDREGHIVTNHHVVDGADLVEVKLHDGMSYQARIVGADPANDIALIKIETDESQLVPVEFGDSSQLKVGQKIFAIGSPFGLEQTMTTGIVSSLNRSIRSRSGRLINSIIQIDAALNQGNSGGALLDSSGRLVGMNTAIKSRVGENSGVGFAIPANTISRVVPQLISNGRVIRSSLGIAKVFKLRTRQGVGLGIFSFTRNSPAEAAGLKSASVIVRRQYGNQIMQFRDEDPRRADVVVGINGVRVDSVDKMLAEVEKYKPGTEITIDLLRGGQAVSVPVVLAEEN